MRSTIAPCGQILSHSMGIAIKSEQYYRRSSTSLRSYTIDVLNLK
ncbi:MAG: hypothetical protein AAGA60_06965 [Cyanobacteria bacterium P01_E01_bin.42]